MRRRRSNNYRPYPAGVGGSGTLQGSGNGSRRNLAGFRGRVKLFQNSILDTCRTLEGVLDDEDTLVELTGCSQLGAVSEHEDGTVEEHGHDQNAAHDHDDLEQQAQGGTRVGADSVSPLEQSPVEQRRHSGSTSLSLDSLYIQETNSGLQRRNEQSRQDRQSMEWPLSGTEPSPLTPSPVDEGWSRGSMEEAEHEVRRQ